MFYRSIASPIGPLLLAGDEEGVRFLLFEHGRDQASAEAGVGTRSGLVEDPARQLTAYFQGQAARVRRCPSRPRARRFSARSGRALQHIPYGETISYGELARRLGNPKAVRAVGLANGSNPISIIIPCHRVIGSNGSLVGYGGGLPTKQALLALERGQASLL